MTQRLPEIEIKILELKRRTLRLGFRIVGSTGEWSTGTWMIEGDTMHVRWPEGFDWQPPVEVIELLYPSTPLEHAADDS